MSRQTVTSRRSPSILVTDVRHQKAHSAPFVSRRLNVSVDSLLSNTSEVPSAQSRTYPRRQTRRVQTSSSQLPAAYGSSSSTRNGAHRGSGAFALLNNNPPSRHDPSLHAGGSSGMLSEGNASSEDTPLLKKPAAAGKNQPKQLKPVPRLSKPLPSRQSKQSQRLVLIPDSAESSSETLKARSSAGSASPDEGDSQRVSSYLISEGVLLQKTAKYLKTHHRARVRLYGDVLFADYLLPLLPGDGNECRIQSSVGDNHTMERMIDISEQGDHHFEYFSSTNMENPSEPHDFSPRPGNAMPSEQSEHTDDISRHRKGHSHNRSGSNVDSGSGGSGNGSESSDSSSQDSSLVNSQVNSQESLEEGSSDSNDSGSESSSESGAHHTDHKEHRASSHEQVHEQVETARRLQRYLSHAEIFVFSYGVVVFWNFTETQEKQVLADLCLGHEEDPLVVKPVGDQDIQSEEMRFRYTQDPSVKPKVFNDLITLNDNSHMLKLAMSHAMAQSTILCGFEDRMQDHLTDVSGVPRKLALTGKLGMNREQLLKISGRLFKLRVDLNLSSNVLEVPDFFWDSEPSLFPLFNALREYLEIDQRVLVINERQSVFLELTSILSDSIAEFNMDRITIIVIWLIVLSIFVSLTEIAVRYFNVSHRSA